jgi:nitric oxide dioxygenase
MLSEQTIATVKSTAPILAKEGENITALFYQKLFDNHPELQHVFNMANQARGEQKKALADSVFAYATHIDKLDALGPAVTRIAHKHASLQIQPDQYPIVGKYLLEAICDHLSISPDDPVIAAWGEAYGALAAIFVSTEEDIYKTNEEKIGGWRGYRAFEITEIVDEAADVKSFYLKAKDGQAIATWQPGQYVGIKTTPDTSDYTEIRQYSLSNAPNNDTYRITVRAEMTHPEQAGVVSNHLHGASIGDELFLQPPTGEFVEMSDEKDIVLLAGGVGITPVLSMLLGRIDKGQDVSKVTFIQCVRDESHHIKGAELKALSEKHGFNYYVSYEHGEGADFKGYLTAEILNTWISNTATSAYFCGPKPFMAAINITLLEIGFTADKLHYETFGPNIRLND